eukprot:TRINITY_DN13438_c0_g1_i1.p1 TRINITY_DN13438_c0_g1~~TRINITY_DN13438_c0_g1_i1.p1  ORF type:complete len:218 (+),score=53.55 TRINITY_DN13438_c0_g1_i1:70-723(+)
MTAVTVERDGFEDDVHFLSTSRCGTYGALKQELQQRVFSQTALESWDLVVDGCAPEEDAELEPGIPCRVEARMTRGAIERRRLEERGIKKIDQAFLMKCLAEQEYDIIRSLVHSELLDDSVFGDALNSMSAQGNVAALQCLLSCSVNPDALSTRSGLTPLMTAAWCGRNACAQNLLAASADPNAELENGWNALMFAAQLGRVDLCVTLLNGGADVKR